MTGIYKITNKYNRKVYVGQSINVERRIKTHKKAVNTDCTYYLYNAFRKYGINSFEFDVIHECPQNQLDYWEKFYIKYYCSNDRRFGYNVQSGGQGWSGCKHTDEYKQHMSEWMTENSDKIHTPQANEKNRIAHTGKKYSPEVNAKKGRKGEESAWYGKHHTEETRKKLSESRKRYLEKQRLKISENNEWTSLLD